MDLDEREVPEGETNAPAQLLLDVFDRPKRSPGVRALVVAVLENETSGRQPAGVVDPLVQWLQVSRPPRRNSPSGLEVDEQRDADQDEYERHDPACDERNLDERRRSAFHKDGHSAVPAAPAARTPRSESTPTPAATVSRTPRSATALKNLRAICDTMQLETTVRRIFVRVQSELFLWGLVARLY